MSSSRSSTVLESSENSPTRIPQPDPTNTVQEGTNRAEHTEGIANGARDENVRLQEQIKQLQVLFKEKEQTLVEEKEAGEKDTLQAKATAKTAQDDALTAVRTAAGQAQTAIRTATSGLQAAVLKARDDAQAAVRTAAAQAQTDVRTAVDQAQRDQKPAEDQKLKTRHKWFFWIVLALVANALLWVSMLYGIFRIEEWGSRRHVYLTRVWMIFTAPLLVVMMLVLMLLFTPCLSNFKNLVCHKYLEVKPWDFGILFMNGTACFVFVVAYLYKSAIPRYHHPVFESGVDFANPLRWPTVVFIAEGDELEGLISVSPSFCAIWDNSTSINTESMCAPGALSENDSIVSGAHTFVFDPSRLRPEKQTLQDFSAEVFIEFDIIYKFSDSATSWEIYTADSRMNLNDLNACGFVNSQTSPMFADVDISLTMENMHDELNVMGTAFANYSGDCESGMRELLSAQDPWYSLYTASITSSGSIMDQNCSAASDQHQCGFVDIILSFGSRIVRTTETKPGISKQEIWINAGAIVGAIQFFAWLLRGG